MIFSKFFRPKYQDPDPKNRIAAIADLSPDNPEHKSHLHELAFNDEDAGVSLAALKRLESFALWCKMAQIASQDRVRKKAQQMVEDALFGQGELRIDEQEKRVFVRECQNNGLLEKLLRQDWLQQGETELVLGVLSKLDKPALDRQIFFSSKDVNLQKHLLEKFDDENTLNKIIKRMHGQELAQLAQTKLDEIQLAKQKPLEVEQKTTLVLSRLLALKDKSDLPVVEQSREALITEFNQLSAEFYCLSGPQRQSFESKFKDINDKLDAWIEQLKPEWTKLQQEQQHATAVHSLKEDVTALIQQVAECLEQDASRITLGQVEQFEEAVGHFKGQLDALFSTIPTDKVPLHRTIETLFNQLNQCKGTLERLPEFQQAIEQANAMLAEFVELDLPSDISQIDAAAQYLTEQKRIWKSLSQSYADVWPGGLNDQWSAALQPWSNAVKALKEQLQQDVTRCKSKLRVIDSLIGQGKYKAAISLYGRVKSWFDVLPEVQKARLQRQYKQVEEQIVNLRDWQDYIAQPRKPALLAEAESLVAEPLAIEEQAQAVKRLRSQWQSLGTADNEADQALNQAFDLTIEKAFEPCRQHYAELQVQREQNLLKKQQLLEQFSRLTGSELDDDGIVEKYRELQQAWREIGEVDYKQLDELNKTYKQLTTPLKHKVDAVYQQRAEQKQKLIKEAEKTLSLDDVFDAVNQAKSLQERWKGIASAGRKQDNQLWAAFRKVNDQIFARRAEVKSAQKQDTDDKVSQLNALIDDITRSLDDAVERASLQQALAPQVEVQQLIGDLPVKLQSKFEKSLRHLVSKQKVKLRELGRQKQRQEYQLLFEALRKWQNEEVPAETTELNSSWQQCFDKRDSADSRHALTVKLEILAERESPKDSQSLRKEIQLQLMADKLQQGIEYDHTALLKAWIQQGPLSQDDLSLLDRVEPVFITH